MSNWGKYRHRGTSTNPAQAVTLTAACFDAGAGEAGAFRLTFSEAIETFGSPNPADVTGRRSNLHLAGDAILSIAGSILLVDAAIGGADVGANRVVLAAGVSSWLRSSLTRVPVTAPTTFTPFDDC